VQKRIKDIIDGVYDHEGARRDQRAAQNQARYEAMGEKDLTRAAGLVARTRPEFERVEAALRTEMHG